MFNRTGDRRTARPRRPNSPSTCRSTTPRRTATSAARPGRSRRRATTTASPARPYPHNRSQGFDEGNVNDKPSFIREAPYLTPTEIHTYRVYYQKALESLRSVDDGVRQIVDTLGAAAPPAQHLHHLHLRQRLLLRRAPPDSAASSSPTSRRPTCRFLIRGPGIKPGTSTGELAANIDIAPTDPRTGRRESRQEHRRALAGALHARPRASAPGARSSSSPSSKPTTSKRTGRTDRRPDPRLNAAAAADTPERRAAGGAKRLDRSRRPRTTRGSASAPTSTSSGPTARRSSTTSTRTPTSSTTVVKVPNSSRSAPSSTANC